MLPPLLLFLVGFLDEKWTALSFSAAETAANVNIIMASMEGGGGGCREVDINLAILDRLEMTVFRIFVFISLSNEE